MRRHHSLNRVAVLCFLSNVLEEGRDAREGRDSENDVTVRVLLARGFWRVWIVER